MAAMGFTHQCPPRRYQTMLGGWWPTKTLLRMATAPCRVVSCRRQLTLGGGGRQAAQHWLAASRLALHQKPVARPVSSVIIPTMFGLSPAPPTNVAHFSHDLPDIGERGVGGVALRTRGLLALAAAALWRPPKRLGSIGMRPVNSVGTIGRAAKLAVQVVRYSVTDAISGRLPVR